jgi:hypothetical protein
MVTRRAGRSRFGCLLGLLLLVTVAYFGINAGEVYLRYYRLTDAMKQEARFSLRFSDDDIRKHLAAFADSLGLPESAGRVRVRRSTNHISISSEYYERIELPLMVRDVLLTPQVEWTY